MTRALLAAAALIVAPPAFGQAFPQPKGEGRVIVSAIYSDAGRGFDADGRTIDIADYQRSELYLLGEYGVTDDVTLLVTPSLRRVRIDGEQTSSGIGFVDLGARWRVAGDESRVFSLQARARIPGSTRRDLPAQIGATDPEFDVRAQGGIGFGAGHFAILEAGYRIRANDPPDEVHLDATVGVRVAPKLLVIGNSFNVFATRDGQGVYRKHRYHNVYASAAYELTPRVTLQAGVLGTVAGRYALRERGAFLGAWFRF